MLEQDRLVREHLVRAGLGSVLIDVRTERGSGELTWAQIRSAKEIVTVEAVWSVDSSVESVARELTEKARMHLSADDLPESRDE